MEGEKLEIKIMQFQKLPALKQPQRWIQTKFVYYFCQLSKPDFETSVRLLLTNFLMNKMPIELP